MGRRKKNKEMEDMGLRDLFKKKEKKADDKLMPEKARIMTEEEMEKEGQFSEDQNRFVGGHMYGGGSLLPEISDRCLPGCIPGNRICPMTGRMCRPGRRGGILGVHIPDTLVVEKRQTDITPFRIQEVHRPKEHDPCDIRIFNPMGNRWFR